MTLQDRIIFHNVSKFYGEVLGVNRVNLSIPPGITGLVGPNGSGKTTLLNLMTGLLQPSKGEISVLGLTPDQPQLLFHRLGYCTQYDSFPKGLTGFQFLSGYLRLYGHNREASHRLAAEALASVRLTNAAHRKIAGYSKGMRQRIKLAQAICHNPDVLVLDEPLNGLDPVGRAAAIELFKEAAGKGKFVIISSHILHEVDMISDQVTLLDSGYVVAEGNIRGVRSEVKDHPMQILIRCNRPGLVASQLFGQDHVVEVKVHEDRRGLFIRSRDAESLYLLLNRVIVENELEIETVTPADEDVESVYDYLIGFEGGSH